MTTDSLSPIRRRVLAASELAYRRLLILFPPSFRREHGDDAARLFRDKVRASLRRGWGVRTPFVLCRSFVDLLFEAARERCDGWREPRGPADRRKGNSMESFVQDVRFASRMLRKQPGISALIVVTLALGIGANTTVFSFVKAIFLNPVGVGDSSTLVGVFGTLEEGGAPGLDFFPISWPNYRDLREQNQTLSGLAGWGFAQIGLSDEAEEPQFEPAQLVSANYFDVLGVTPEVGRFFRADEEEPAGAHAVAVISHSLWAERYGSEESVVGRDIRVNGYPFTVVGVAPDGFDGTGVLGNVRLWAPMSMHPQMHAYTEFVEARRWRMFQLGGRLAEGVTLQQAEADLRAISMNLANEYPDDNQGRLVQLTRFADVSLNPNDRGMFVNSSAFLLAVSGIVLLIACANVANLMLARARARNREIAVRLSLGAGRWRIVRQLGSEAMLLAGLGGIASIGVAVAGRDLLWAFRPPFLAAHLEIGLDYRVLAITAMLTTATGLAFALAPALRATRVNAASTLRQGTASTDEGRAGWASLRSSLVVVQVALSFLAIVGAGLFLSSLQQAQLIDTGFPDGELLLAPINPAAQGYTEEGALQFYDDVALGLQAVAGVTHVGFASNPPLTGTFLSRTTIREGDPEDQSLLIGTNAVNPEFFAAMDMALISGRVFDAADRSDGRGVIVINDVMSETLWPQDDPIGKRVRFLGETEYFEVVGVVSSIKYNTLGEAQQPYFYHPIRQRYAGSGTFHVRATGSPSAIAGQVRDVIRGIDPGIPLNDFDTAADRIEALLWAPRMGASLLSVFGTVSLVLALVGIYGVLAQLVGERTREIGIRIALGADRGSVVRLVAQQTLRWVAIGGLLGVGGALAVSSWLSSFLYGIDGADPATYALAALTLLLAAAVAASLPARRAARIDPAIAMRQE